MKKTAVIFPGVGYTKDRPLLYYSGKLAASFGYELVHVDFSGIDWSKEKLKDPDFLKEALDICLKRIDGVIPDPAELAVHDTVFISKSIGTVAACAYAHKHSLDVPQLCFSPLEMIEGFVKKNGAVLFYGDADPFADPASIEKIAKDKSLMAVKIAGGNHSLETGDIFTDIDNMKLMMERVKRELS